ncbi:MAG: FliM/FliN family flagellar motor switch protein [Deltaproteobacteria bacterium]|nr:FliM/FliN family flagellar motor switch protein [Deltaproteobacteria bacterium]MCB9787785.1 FliM/FliN family flagellar motor switch protein [Deltaproteobacteria bacterium]
MSSSDELLTAEELAALSEAFSGSPRAPRATSEVRAEDDTVVLRYDLVGGSSNQRHDYPALDLVHEAFALHLGATLQRAMRQYASFVPTRPDILNFSEVYASLPTPCSIVVLEVEGVSSTGLLVFAPNLLQLFFDLLMGGTGTDPPPTSEQPTARGFTPTERHLIRHLLGFVNHSLRAAWADIVPMSIRMVRAEMDPRHAAIFNPSERVVELRVDVVWGEVRGDVRFIVPMAALKPFEKRLARTAVSSPNPADPGWSETIRARLGEVEVNITAVLGRAEMTVRDLLRLEVGDVLRLDRDPEAALEVLVEGVEKYAGKATVQQGNMAVTLAATKDELRAANDGAKAEGTS